MSRYNRVASNEETAEVEESGVITDSNGNVLSNNNSNELTQSPADSSAPKSTVPPIHSVDGVFGALSRLTGGSAPSSTPAVAGSSNVTDIPQNSKQFEEFEPPSYNEALHDSSPPYFETTVISIDGEGDVLIEGFPCGNWFAFYVSLLISMSFDFIGFLLTSLLATSHGARFGARAGLGITLIRYGLYIQTQDVDEELAQYKFYNPDDNETREEVIEQNNWTAYVFLIIGIFLILRSYIEFIKVQRLKAVVVGGSDESTRV